ncbi:MAG: hypothetical protein H6Q85_1833, partial [candidate division NC10 bacterium]|nr:hypothetical protein [candidate division NC10 bacterium]
MEPRAISDIAADLRALGVSRGPAPRLPNGARPSNEMLDRWAR